jgi:sugar lactone lactonase YvrE
LPSRNFLFRSSDAGFHKTLIVAERKTMFRRLLPYLSSPAKTGIAQSSGATPRIPIAALLIAALPLILGVAYCSTASAQAASFTGFQRVLPFNNLSQPSAVAVDANGNIFVADQTAGDVVKETPLAAGGYTATTIATISSPTGVAVDSSGNVYIAGSENSTVGVYVVTPSAGGYSTPTAIGTGLTAPYGVAVDASGNVYVADPGAAAVYILSPNGSGGYNTPSAIGSGWVKPQGVAVDTLGDVYVADATLPYVSVLTVSTNTGGGYNAPVVAGASLGAPSGIAVDGRGNIYVSDSANNVEWELPSAGGPFTVSYGQAIVATGLNAPLGTAVDALGNAYIAGGAAANIQELSNNFGSINVGSTSSGNNIVTANFTFSSASTPGALAVLTQGTKSLDFTDAGTGTCSINTPYTAGESCTVNLKFKPAAPGIRLGSVALVDGSGNLISTAGTVQGTGVGPQISFLPGTVTTAAQNLPWTFGIAADAAGNLYTAISTWNTGSVMKGTLTAGSYNWTTIASNLNYPTAVAVDGSGNVFIGASNTVYEAALLPNGQYNVTQVISNLPDQVYGIAVDGNENLYFNDANNYAVYVASPANFYTPVQVGTAIPGGQGLAVDAHGNIFDVDQYDGKVFGLYLQPNGTYTQATVVTGLDVPTSVQADANGNLFIVDCGYDTGISVLYEAVLNPAALQAIYAGGWNSNAYTLQPIATMSNAVDEFWYSATDGLGNFYLTDQSGVGNIYKIDVADGPALSFAGTTVGSISTDSPQTVVVANYGNAPLSFPALAAASNPSISANFNLNSSGTAQFYGTTLPDCLLASASNAPSLAPEGLCALSISFAPAVAGQISGSLVLTDNNLNAVSPKYAVQTIALSSQAAAIVATPTVTLTSSATPAFVGNPITLVASVTGPVLPTGTVTFFDGSKSIGTGTLDGGAASLTLSSLAAGSHTLTATYGGSASYATASSAPITEVLADFSIAATGTAAATIKTSGSATFTFTVSPISPATSLPAAINLTVSGGPASASYTLTPQTLASGAAATSITLTVNLPTQTSALGINQRLPGSRLPASLALAFLLLPLAGKLRKAGKRLNKMAVLLLLLVAGMTATAGLSSCGGSGRPPTNYNITVTGASGALSHSTNVVLTVE